MRTLLLAVIVLLGALSASVNAESVRYRLTDIGEIPEHIGMFSGKINDSGQVIGNYKHNPSESSGYWEWELFTWDPSGELESMVSQLDPTWTDRRLVDINAHGQVIGLAFIPPLADGFIPPGRPGGSFLLDPEQGFVSVAADRWHIRSLNDDGWFIADKITLQHAEEGTHVIDAFASAETQHVMLDTNNGGQVLGVYMAPDAQHAFIYDTNDNSVLDLGAIGPVQTMIQTYRTFRLNDNGQALIFDDYLDQYFVWNSDDGRQYVAGGAADMNNLGQLVGDQYDSRAAPYDDYPYRAAIQEVGSEPQFLEDLLNYSGEEWVFDKAMSINNHGQILVRGYVGDQERLALLTPVPEPSTLTLTLISASISLVICLVMWRRVRHW